MSSERDIDVATFGESMVAFVSRDGSPEFGTTVAGAESNLAVALSELGCRVRWVSRVGDDPLGRLIISAIEARGVDVVADRDPEKPTGVLVRHVSAGGTQVQYYRSESAARRLAPAMSDRAGDATWCHLTGITPALSATAAELVATIFARSDGPAGRLSFDVNYRPALWPDDDAAARVLLPLARRADVVFIGDDESESLFGTSEVGELGDLLLQRDDQELVLKRGRGPASLLTRGRVVTEPAVEAVVIDPTGAGDAFAAGYLAGHVFGLSASRRLRLAHEMGARAVGAVDDMVGALSTEEFEELSVGGLVVTPDDRAR